MPYKNLADHNARRRANRANRRADKQSIRIADPSKHDSDGNHLIWSPQLQNHWDEILTAEGLSMRHGEHDELIYVGDDVTLGMLDGFLVSQGLKFGSGRRVTPRGHGPECDD